MGVPKFYRWISERYPCLSQVVKEFQVDVYDCENDKIYVMISTILILITVFGIST